MEFVAALDRQLFLFFNHLPHTTVLDTFAMAISGIGTAGAVWFLVGIWLFIKEQKKDHWFFMPLAVSGFGSWFLVEKFFKPFLGRMRPTADWGAIIVDQTQLDSYAFPSGHASLAWAMSTVLAFEEPKKRWWLYLLAFAISLSRIYLGKHYPLDVIAGSLLGVGIGHGALFLSRRILPHDGGLDGHFPKK